MSDLNLVEIFWSVQGEGVHVGTPSAFVRLGVCDLRCAWCDSVETWLPAKRCRIETEPGSGGFEERDNPTGVAAAAAAVRRLQGERGGWVSITGGEPLLQPAGVVALARALREGSLRGGVSREESLREGALREDGPEVRILLETHGLAVDALSQVIDHVDCVSMDWKLASDVRRASDPRHGPVADFHAQHERFLAAAAAHPGVEVYVKAVVTPASRDDELETICEAIARVAPQTPLILQPVTPSGPVREAPSAAALLRWLRRCQRHLPDVRVVPQTHKSLGVA